MRRAMITRKAGTSQGMTAENFAATVMARSTCSGVACCPLFSIRCWTDWRMSLGSMRLLARTPTRVETISSTASATPQVGRSAIERKVLTGDTRAPINRPAPESSRAAMGLPPFSRERRAAEAEALAEGVGLRSVVDHHPLLVEEPADRPVVLGERGAVVHRRLHLGAARLGQLILDLRDLEAGGHAVLVTLLLGVQVLLLELAGLDVGVDRLDRRVHGAGGRAHLALDHRPLLVVERLEAVDLDVGGGAGRPGAAVLDRIDEGELDPPGAEIEPGDLVEGGVVVGAEAAVAVIHLEVELRLELAAEVVGVAPGLRELQLLGGQLGALDDGDAERLLDVDGDLLVGLGVRRRPDRRLPARSRRQVEQPPEDVLGVAHRRHGLDDPLLAGGDRRLAVRQLQRRP